MLTLEQTGASKIIRVTSPTITTETSFVKTDNGSRKKGRPSTYDEITTDRPYDFGSVIIDTENCGILEVSLQQAQQLVPYFEPPAPTKI